MVPAVKEEHTEKQSKFLDVLFGEAKGNPTKAKALAGYAESVPATQVVKSVRSAIIQRAEDYLAAHSPMAVMGLVGAMDYEESVKPGIRNRMAAYKELLDRIGIVKTERIEIEGKVTHGIFILPPKDELIDVTPQEG